MAGIQQQHDLSRFAPADGSQQVVPADPIVFGKIWIGFMREEVQIFATGIEQPVHGQREDDQIFRLCPAEHLA